MCVVCVSVSVVIFVCVRLCSVCVSVFVCVIWCYNVCVSGGVERVKLPDSVVRNSRQPIFVVGSNMGVPPSENR